MYKIKRIADGQFSRGGMWRQFSKTGKVWNTLGGLKLHLNQFLRGTNYAPNPSNVYDGCIVIMYDDVNGGIKEDIFDIQQYLKNKQEELIERERERKARRSKYEDELAELKRRYGRI